MDGDTTRDLRYAPPQAHVEDVAAPGGGLVPASRMQRFWAFLVDLGISIGALWVASVLTPWDPFEDKGLWTPDLVSPLAGFALFAAINGWLLARNGQTLGKALFGLRIVRSNGERASLARLLFLRYGVGQALSIVMPVGQVFGLVDALLIFRASRRCLHDLIADTIVVKA